MVPCTICGSPIARWQNMPGHYRRAHPDVLLPEAIARFGLQRNPRPMLPGRKAQRALPQHGHSARPRIQRGLSSEARYVASLPGAVEGSFVSVLDDSPAPVVQLAGGIASVEEKSTDFRGWIPWVMLLMGVVFFCVLQPSTKIKVSDARLISGYQPEGVEQ